MKKFVLIFRGYEMPTPERVAAWNEWLGRRAESITDVGHSFGPGRLAWRRPRVVFRINREETR